MQQPEDIEYLNFWAVTKRWIGSAILSGNVRGVELLLNDLEIFVRDAKDHAKGLRTEFPIVTESEKNHLWNDIFVKMRILQGA